MSFVYKSEKGRTRREFVIGFAAGTAAIAAAGPLIEWEAFSYPVVQAGVDRKYAKYIVTKPPSRSEASKTPSDLDKLETPKLHPILGLNNSVVEGAIMVNCSWIWAGEDPGRMEAHVHPYAEVIGFAGTNPQDPNDLGAEAELWMDDEQYIIKNSFLVYVPSGLKHCPLVVRDIKYNIFHFDIQLTQGEFRAAPGGR